jgi:Na+-driven multidrug efflux pump
LRVAWTGAAIAAALTEAIGLAAAFFPTAWLSLFSRDAQMIEVGSSYLRIVGPFYGFFGGGLALYFASQGAGRVARPMMFAVLRVIIAVGGGWIAVAEFGGSQRLFAVLAFALVFYGLGNVASVAGGAWFKVARNERETPDAEALVRAR